MKHLCESVVKLRAANDNAARAGAGPKTEMAVTCRLPEGLGVIEGEADLVAQFFGELVRQLANDNGPETGETPLNLPSSEDEAP